MWAGRYGSLAGMDTVPLLLSLSLSPLYERPRLVLAAHLSCGVLLQLHAVQRVQVQVAALGLLLLQAGQAAGLWPCRGCIDGREHAEPVSVTHWVYGLSGRLQVSAISAESGPVLMTARDS